MYLFIVCFHTCLFFALVFAFVFVFGCHCLKYMGMCVKKVNYLGERKNSTPLEDVNNAMFNSKEPAVDNEAGEEALSL